MNPEERKDWLQTRCGCVGASRIHDVMAKPLKGAKEATTRRNYRAQLICERMTGNVEEEYISYDMKRGMELEPDARAAYEYKQDVVVETSGFVMHERISNAGATPDGLIGKDGLVQFKCPKPATHIDWLMAGRVPTEYIPQMLFEMSCTGRQWSDFVSYCPQMRQDLQLFIVRLARDEQKIAEIESEVIKFDVEVEETIKLLPNGQSLEETLAQSVKQAKERTRDNSLLANDDDLDPILAGQNKLENARRNNPVQKQPEMAHAGTLASQVMPK